MFFEVLKSEGLAHLSYLIGDGNQAAVIDPKRDCEDYITIAHRNGARITHIFETHRNEDYVVGSCDLARRTGAEIYHGGAIDFKYGNSVSDGDTFDIGSLKLRVLETPGHTFESISIALADTEFSDEAIGVFTGDALFIGQVGRTDFFPDRAEEVAGLLYDSITGKLLPLGDQCLVYPAHGAGSVCGSGMASREFSSIGYERAHNPALQVADRDAFIRMKLEETHYQPSYFRKMEEYNQNGNAPELNRLPTPLPYSPDAFKSAIESGLAVLDLRSPEAFGGAFIPGTLCMPLEMLPAYAGYYLDYDTPIGLVAETPEDIPTAVVYLIRLGYDNIQCFLDGGVHSWSTSGFEFDHISAVHCDIVDQRLQKGANFTLLDVRKLDEVEESRLAGSKHIFLGQLPQQIEELAKERKITTFCDSGQRAMIAASILKTHGFTDVENNLGSMSACKARNCESLET